MDNALTNEEYISAQTSWKRVKSSTMKKFGSAVGHKKISILNVATIKESKKE